MMNGIPIGPPSHIPAPKSAWNPRLAPIVFTIVVELERTGSVSTGVFQMLLAGRTGQLPIIGCADAVPDNAKPSTTPNTVVRVIERSSGVLLSMEGVSAEDG